MVKNSAKQTKSKVKKTTHYENYSEAELNILREGGRRLASILELLSKECNPGVRAKDLDLLAEKLVREGGDIPVFKNYQPSGARYPFPASLCVSINHVVAHGIPGEEILQEGDVVSLDLGLRHEGLVVDSAITVLVGDQEKSAKFFREQKLLDVTKQALFIGIDACRVGARVNEVGAKIERYVKQEGFNVVDILCGHAVGREVHSEPLIPHADFGSGGELIKEGMVLAIEPHISMGSGEISLSKEDHWSYIADDNAKSAQFEHTIHITKSGPEILTG
mgnify:CR=1 FL=1